MKYSLYSPYRSRERILIMGASKVGKTSAVLSMAKYQPTATFHIIDNDNAYEAMRERGDDEYPNLDIYEVDEWDETYNLVRELRDRIRESGDVDDWLVIDLLSNTWDQIQSEFVEETFGTTIEDYMMDKRKKLEGRRKEASKESGGALGVFEQNTDWTTINAVYRGLQKMLRNFPCHVVVCCEVDKLDSKTADREIVRQFGPYGVKPRGQKRTPHLFHTILILSKLGANQYVMTTVGDRQRPELDDDEVGEFAVSYLQRVAKWKIKVNRKVEKVEEGVEDEPED